MNLKICDDELYTVVGEINKDDIRPFKHIDGKDSLLLTTKFLKDFFNELDLITNKYAQYSIEDVVEMLNKLKAVIK